MLTHFLGQQVDILLIATLGSIVELYQGQSLEKQRWMLTGHSQQPTPYQVKPSQASAPLQPTASPPAAVPPGELTRMAGRKVQVHTSRATVWLFVLLQRGSYFLVLVCLPRAFFFLLPSFLSFLLPFLSSSLSSPTRSLSFSDLDYGPGKREFYHMMLFYFSMTKVHLLLLKKTIFPESF